MARRSPPGPGSCCPSPSGAHRRGRLPHAPAHPPSSLWMQGCCPEVAWPFPEVAGRQAPSTERLAWCGDMKPSPSWEPLTGVSTPGSAEPSGVPSDPWPHSLPPWTSVPSSPRENTTCQVPPPGPQACPAPFHCVGLSAAPPGWMVHTACDSVLAGSTLYVLLAFSPGSFYEWTCVGSAVASPLHRAHPREVAVHASGDPHASSCFSRSH